MPGAQTQGHLTDRIALVTGATRGIGRAVALRFADEGAQLILTGRTTGALEEVDDEIQKRSGQPATLVPMDLTDFDAIDRLGAGIFERFGKLDILIGNAGMLGTLSPLGHTDPRVWDHVMAVNLTANWRLIRSMDPLLRQSDAGRAVFVTSTVGHTPRAYWSAYAVSKAALEMAVKIYAEETAETPIRVNLYNPGATRTSMRARAFPGEPPESVKPPESVTEDFVRLSEPACGLHGETVTADPKPEGG
ncbi:MAG: SDR family NAD(P)-dependent oxidoreductase [Rhodospirillaceae bacterium]